MIFTDFFRFDSLSIFIGIFVVFFSLLVIIYSFGFTPTPIYINGRRLKLVWGFMRNKNGLLRYYLYIILTLLASLGAVFSNNLILFIVFWGFSGLLLYLLISFGEKENTPCTAKKTFIIIGGSDALMLLGIAFIWQLTGSFQMDRISIALNTNIAIWAYLFLAAAAFAKAGAMPLHTWVPDTAEDAPIPVTAYLPASLDKLLGIYFLTRISIDMFIMNTAMNTFLMFIGSITIIAAVMMALVQHDLNRLLGYHAVSQVGYMVLGIGTGNPVGIAGGLFHMLNHAIYKSCLFLSSGTVEKKANTTDLEKLGGFIKIMPVTFVVFLIASLAISGIPPFNGFFSKWMIYQGLIETGKSGYRLWVIWLIAAMFGSALTLASFMKALHCVFLGQPFNEQRTTNNEQRTIGYTMLIPSIVLALLCIVFGVFAYQIPLKIFILPSLKTNVVFPGIWDAKLAAVLLLVGIIVGIIIYILGAIKKAKETEPFVGGEFLKEHRDMRISGVEFYNTIKDIGPLKTIYNLAEKKVFDIYEVGAKITFGFTKILRYIHNGVLPSYLAWCLLGMGALFYMLLLRK